VDLAAAPEMVPLAMGGCFDSTDRDAPTALRFGNDEALN
jgi:hypothetical protein